MRNTHFIKYGLKFNAAGGHSVDIRYNFWVLLIRNRLRADLSSVDHNTTHSPTVGGLNNS